MLGAGSWELGVVSAPHPDEFRVSLTTPSGVSYSLHWNDGALEYRAYNEHFDPTRMEKTEPSLEAWARLWQAFESADIWNWQARYLNPAEAEGAQWQITLRLGDRAVRSYGDNAFPGGEAAPDGVSTPSPQFELLYQALKHLIGGLPLE